MVSRRQPGLSNIPTDTRTHTLAFSRHFPDCRAFERGFCFASATAFRFLSPYLYLFLPCLASQSFRRPYVVSCRSALASLLPLVFPLFLAASPLAFQALCLASTFSLSCKLDSSPPNGLMSRTSFSFASSGDISRSSAYPSSSESYLLCVLYAIFYHSLDLEISSPRRAKVSSEHNSKSARAITCKSYAPLNLRGYFGDKIERTPTSAKYS